MMHNSQIFTLILVMLTNKEITLTWNGLAAQINGKKLLHDCEGYCQPGEMLAIMGPSGAGKTTLLSLLSQKADSKLKVSGSVFANNCPFNVSQFYNFGVYIYQNDILHQTLTVRETLQFIAVLTYKKSEVAAQRVNELIQEFQLQKCQHSHVGGQNKKGISGGEKKRLCIAVEMVSRPSLLILDQPTSGLDSHKAGSVLRVLRRLTKDGCTVIFTIHQPSHLLYSMLTRLILLDKGTVIYQGQAQNMVNYISQLNISILQHMTISDFFMLQISQFKQQRDKHVTTLNHDNYMLRLAPTIQQQLLKLKQEQPGYPKSITATTFLFMLSTLFNRQLTIYIRSPAKLIGAIANAVVGIIIVGIFFIDQIPSPTGLIQLGQFIPYNGISQMFLGIQGVCFISITSMIFTGRFAVQLAFPTDRQIYYKESSSKKYYPSAYFLAKMGMQLLNIIFCTILFGSAVYWLNGFDPTIQKFGKYLLTLMLMSLAGNSFGFFIGAMFEDGKQAAALGPLFDIPLMAFSGMYNKLNDIPSWISWLSYISPFRYGLHLVMQNQYQQLKIPTIDGKVYDYRQDLNMPYSFFENVFISIGISLAFYIIAFIMLKKLTSKITV